MIPTLISTATASDATSVAITSGIDGTYDEYMFVLTDIGPATDTYEFSFQCSIDSGSNYNVAVTSTAFNAYHSQADDEATLGYQTGNDQAQGTAYQKIMQDMGNGSDESGAGILHLFSPASTVFVKHFYSRCNLYHMHDVSTELNIAGYFNTTSAIDAISFKMSSGNFDGVIQLFGVA